MPVFKLCIKIIKKNMASMLIYIGIFLGILVLISAYSTKSGPTSYTDQKINVAFISQENSPLIDGLKDQLSKRAEFVNIPDETEKLQDALYFRNVEYIIRIPKGFTQSFMNGKDVQIEKTIVPSSTSSAYIDYNINQYLNNARLYVKYTPGITQEELVKKLNNDLSVDTKVEIKQFGQSSSHNYARNYFNYLAYAMFAVLILGISAIMIVFNNKDLQRRNFCSPVHASSLNAQFMLANFVFSAAVWGIMMIFYLLFDWNNINCTNTLYFLLNSIVFTFCGACLSYLIGNLMKSREAISAVCNVVTLGPCFISGVLVPQELLGDTVLKVASFTPTYWFVKANAQIAALTNFNFDNLSPVFTNILIELGFGIAFFLLSLVIGKRRRMATN